jgi:hypothetical protein
MSQTSPRKQAYCAGTTSGRHRDDRSSTICTPTSSPSRRRLPSSRGGVRAAGSPSSSSTTFGGSGAPLAAHLPPIDVSIHIWILASLSFILFCLEMGGGPRDGSTPDMAHPPHFYLPVAVYPFWGVWLLFRWCSAQCNLKPFLWVVEGLLVVGHNEMDNVCPWVAASIINRRWQLC